MPRTQRKRKVFLPPYKRSWKSRNNNTLETIFLTYDEYESIKLLDYEDLKQEEVAKIMDVSRPTLTRIYESARKKMANALVKNAHIEISGGNVEVHESWYFCHFCDITFNIYDGPVFCPLCKNTNNISKRADQIKNENQ
jgi:predicted DNA-binding protein (UPF0251 family)